MAHEDWNEHQIAWYWVSRLVGLTLLVVVSYMAGCPLYNVWERRLDGQAELARAQSTRQVLVAQAEAEREAASKRAEAIAIVGRAAKEFPEYRLQEFIGAFAEALHAGKISQIIYVPTEGSIPILEAGKR